MKVAIVYPEAIDIARFHEKRKEFPPFGVLYLAAVMEREGIDIHIFKVYPGNTSLDLHSYDAVAYSIPSSASYGLIKETRFSSLYSDDPFIMVGGVHANYYPEETLLDIKPHVVGVGEGEITILELLQEYQSRNFAWIKGVCYLEGSTPVRTPPRPLIKDLDVLPFPARHLLPESDFIMNDRLSNTDLRMAHIMLSRGCPFPCRFCGSMQKKMQYRSGHSARQELVHLIENHKIEGFAILDDNFIVNKKRVHNICLNIRDIELPWSTLCRVDMVDKDLFKLISDSGCIEVKFGVESGSVEMLKVMGKNTTPEQIRYAVRTTHTLGMKAKIYLIHGFPGENWQTT